MADNVIEENVIEENVIDKIQVKGKEYYFGIKYDSERNIIKDTYFKKEEMPQIEQVVTKAGAAMTGAEKVDATITNNVFEVTDRTGTKKSLDMSSLVSAQDAIKNKIDKTSIVQELGGAEDKVMSQKAVSNKFNELITSLKAQFSYKGIAKPTTNPGVPDSNVFYIAGEGTYTNFSNLVIEVGQLGILKWDGSWHKEVLEIGAGGGNMILEWNTDVATTRKQVPQKYRKQGIQISYLHSEKGWINEQYIGTNISDSYWVYDCYWVNINDKENDIIASKIHSAILYSSKEIILGEEFWHDNAVWNFTKDNTKAVLNKINGYYYTNPIKIPKGVYMLGTENNSNIKSEFLVDRYLNVVNKIPLCVLEDNQYVCFSSNTKKDIKLYIYNDLILLEKQLKYSSINLITLKGYYNESGVLDQSYIKNSYASDLIAVSKGDKFFIDGAFNGVKSGTFGVNYYNADRTLLKGENLGYKTKSIFTANEDNVSFISFYGSKGITYDIPYVCKINKENEDYLLSSQKRNDLFNQGFYVSSFSQEFKEQYTIGDELNEDSFPLIQNLSANGYLALKNNIWSLARYKDYYIVDVELISADGLEDGDILIFSFPQDLRLKVGYRRKIYCYNSGSSDLRFTSSKQCVIKIYSITQVAGSNISIPIPEGSEYCSIGDSITWANNAYNKIIATRFGLKLTNLAEGGATLQRQTTDERLAMIPNKVALFTITCGTNGNFKQVNEGISLQEDIIENINDTTPETTIGSCNRAVNAARAKNPDCRIIFIAPPSGQLNENDAYKHTQVFKAVADNRSCMFVNTRILPMNRETVTNPNNIYTKDQIHPSDDIYIQWANLIIQEMIKYYAIQ